MGSFEDMKIDACGQAIQDAHPDVDPRWIGEQFGFTPDRVHLIRAGVELADKAGMRFDTLSSLDLEFIIREMDKELGNAR